METVISFLFGMLAGGFLIGCIFRREIKLIRRKLLKKAHDAWDLGYEDGYTLGYSDALRNQRKSRKRSTNVTGVR